MIAIPATVVTDGVWGDNGKGKITDILSSQEGHRIGYQFGGGGGAGHTIETGGVVYRLKTIPATVITPGTVSFCGHAKNIYPPQFLEDVQYLTEHGVTVEAGENLMVSELATLVYSADRILDGLTGGRVGTTGSGTGPSQAGRMLRTALLMGDLLRLDDPEVKRRIGEDLRWKNAVIAEYGGGPIPLDKIMQELAGYARQMEPYVHDIEPRLRRVLEAAENIACEMTQSWGLGIIQGGYPYVTAANLTVGAANSDGGIPLRCINRVITVSKVPYNTRVGEGSFIGEFGDYGRVKAEEHQEPVEMSPADIRAALAGDEFLLGRWFRNLGNERGTKTKRPRRTGRPHWGMVRTADWVNGTTEHALMKADIMIPGYEVVPIVGEERDGEAGDFFRNGERTAVLADRGYSWPPITDGEERTRLVEGGFDALGKKHRELQEYALDFAAFTGRPVRYISIGPDRTQTITRGVFEATSEGIPAAARA